MHSVEIGAAGDIETYAERARGAWGNTFKSSILVIDIQRVRFERGLTVQVKKNGA